MRAEPLLEVVVGARQVGHGIAVKQPGPVAAGNLAEVPDRVGERTGLAAMANHGADQAVEAALDHGGALVLVVVQHPRCRMHPGIGALHIRPKRGRVLQAAADQLTQFCQLRRRAPFCATRSRLLATFSKRVLSLRPGAASGARPSSVMALRTAAQ